MNLNKPIFTITTAFKNYMNIYYILFSLLLLLLVILLGSYFWGRRKSIPSELFSAALKNENSGDFEAAIVNYKSALDEVKKARFNSDLEKRILEKLKVLHTNIEYQKGFRIIR
jgi:hypothetical protein